MVKVDWEKIDTVLLDLDGTLLDLHFDNHFWLEHVPLSYAQARSISVEDAKQQLRTLYGEFGGTLNWYCIDFWTDRIELDIRALKEQVKDKIAVRPHAEEFLQMLNTLQKDVVLVTNAHQASVSLKMRETHLDKYFTNMISSHEFGMAKEEPGFWQRLNSVQAFENHSTLFIDDNLTVLKSASDYGIEHLRAIRMPDSKGPEIHTEDYAVIDHYQDIMIK